MQIKLNNANKKMKVVAEFSKFNKKLNESKHKMIRLWKREVFCAPYLTRNNTENKTYF